MCRGPGGRRRVRRRGRRFGPEARHFERPGKRPFRAGRCGGRRCHGSLAARRLRRFARRQRVGCRQSPSVERDVLPRQSSAHQRHRRPVAHAAARAPLVGQPRGQHGGALRPHRRGLRVPRARGLGLPARRPRRDRGPPRLGTDRPRSESTSPATPTTEGASSSPPPRATRSWRRTTPRPARSCGACPFRPTRSSSAPPRPTAASSTSRETAPSSPSTRPRAPPSGRPRSRARASPRPPSPTTACSSRMDAPRRRSIARRARPSGRTSPDATAARSRRRRSSTAGST